MGPYLITNQINPLAFQLQLPATLCIHPVFYWSLLVAVSAPDLAQPPPLASPPPVFINGEEEYEVRQILDSQYLMDWEGYGPED